MPNQTTYMTRINTHLLKGFFGETTTVLFGGGAAGLGFLEIITPILALIAVLLAVISGIYTLRIKRIDLKQRLLDKKN